MADRIEREIEEILRKLDTFVPDGPRKPAPKKASEPPNAAQTWFAHALARISLKRVMMWALVIVIIAFVARGFPGATWLMLGGLIVLATAFLLSRNSGAPKSQQLWRGQPIDLSGPSWPNRIKAWVKGRRRA